MRKFVTWTVHAERGLAQFFTLHQTPQEVADEMTRELTVPAFLAKGGYFSLGVRPLPEGMDLPDDLPRDHPYQHAYMQVGGSYQAMRVDVRVPDPTGGYTHYVVARQPVQDPGAWVPVTWDNGGDEPFTTRVHPEEVFTGHQAVPLFRDYILNSTTPPPHLLRRDYI